MSLEDLAFPPTAPELLERLQTPGRVAGGGAQTRPIQPQPLDFAEDWGGAQTNEKPEVHARNLLVLDLGTHTGWALRRRDGTIIHGTESFTPRASWTAGQRWLRYRSWLSALIDREQIHVVTFERVVFGHSSASASDVYGGFRAITEMVADSHGCTLDSVAVPTIKKHWTGHGFAKKPDMIAEAKRRGFKPADDNAADALAILHYAMSKEDE